MSPPGTLVLETPRSGRARRLGRLLGYLRWLLAFYAAWAGLVIAYDAWPVIARRTGASPPRWPRLLRGGLDAHGRRHRGPSDPGPPLRPPASPGRDFGFAIQSIGMTSASIFVLGRGRLLERRLLAWTMLGALVATPLGVAILAPKVDERLIKLVFAVAWGSFGLLHLLELSEICGATGGVSTSPAFDRPGGRGSRSAPSAEASSPR